jgi:integrase
MDAHGRWHGIECAAGVCALLREQPPVQPPRPRLLDQVRAAIRTRHLSRRTEEAYVLWTRRYVVFHGRRPPREMGAPEIGRFLAHLATERKVSASTQNQALAALLFLYWAVLGVEIPWVEGVVRAKSPLRLPVVFTREEVRALLEALDGIPRLVALLIYGAGLRLLEALRLRVKDVDLDRRQLVVRRGKGDRDRVTMLPAAARTDLAAQIGRVRRQHDDDLRHGAGWVELPR